MADIERWKEFVEEGDILYNYMVNNFKEMINETIIRHFNITYGRSYVIDYVDDINEEDNIAIQLKLIPWIQKEGKSLFEYNNWMPFRDEIAMTDMYLGYRKMFIYKHYVFQLSLTSGCDYFDLCNNCKNGMNNIHFVASLYGWKDDNYVNLQPENRMTILEDNIMPDSYWYRDRKYCIGK